MQHVDSRFPEAQVAAVAAVVRVSAVRTLRNTTVSRAGAERFPPNAAHMASHAFGNAKGPETISRKCILQFAIKKMKSEFFVLKI